MSKEIPNMSSLLRHRSRYYFYLCIEYTLKRINFGDTSKKLYINLIINEQ